MFTSACVTISTEFETAGRTPSSCPYLKYGLGWSLGFRPCLRQSRQSLASWMGSGNSTGKGCVKSDRAACSITCLASSSGLGVLDASEFRAGSIDGFRIGLVARRGGVLGVVLLAVAHDNEQAPNRRDESSTRWRMTRIQS